MTGPLPPNAPAGAGAPPTPYQRDVLELAAAFPGARLAWDVPVAPDSLRAAVVTSGDTWADWFHAGRAAAHVLLRQARFDIDGVSPDLLRLCIADADGLLAALAPAEPVKRTA